MFKDTVSFRYLMTALCMTLLVTLFTGCGKITGKTAYGMELIEQLDYSGALAAFEEAKTAGENERLIERGRGIAYMGLTDYEAAISCFESALSMADGLVKNVDYDINYYMAACFMKLNDFQGAKDRYNAILALKSDEENAYFLRGICSLALEDFDNAKADFDTVYSMDSKNYDRIIEIYQALAKYNYTSVGEDYLWDVLTKESDNMSEYDKGRIYYYLGEYEQAAMALEQSRDKGGAESYLYLGRAYEATGEYNYATSVYNSFLAKDSSNAEMYNQLGLCEIARGNYYAALEAFQNGLNIENNEIRQTLLFNEIVAYEYLGDFDVANIKIKEYLKLYPDDEEAVREQIFLNTR